MSVLDEARELVRNSNLSPELMEYAAGGYYWDGQYSDHVGELTSGILASTLSYQIKLKGSRIGDESLEPLGISKYHGLPHLPADMAWPKDMLFAGQVNLADLAKVDVTQRFPTSGWLYFFYNGAAECAAIHWDGPVEELELREYPDDIPDAKYYLKNFLKGERVEFEPYWLFYLNQGDAYGYRDLRPLLDESLVGAISEKLGASMSDRDCTNRIYGRPHYWQGEDEGGAWMEEAWDAEGNPAGGADTGPDLLLFQDELGEANIHLWGAPDEIAKGDFSGVWLGHSGT